MILVFVSVFFIFIERLFALAVCLRPLSNTLPPSLMDYPTVFIYSKPDFKSQTWIFFRR